jgi:hypothetical protein
MEQELIFEGSDYIHELDSKRLKKQHYKVLTLMQDGKFRTLPEISELIKEPPASISAQLRHFRKKSFGSHIVNKKYLGNGLYSYQLILNTSNNGENN